LTLTKFPKCQRCQKCWWSDGRRNWSRPIRFHLFATR
jgi:hypothetical protein